VLGYITVLLVCQLLGEILTRLFGLPVPGPVLGMAILFCGLLVRGHVPDELEKTSAGLLRYLSLLFVPAGVGIIVHLHVLADALLPIAGTVVVGTVITMVVTGWVMQRLNASRNRGEEP
jgi:holin-like protein